MKQYIIPLVCIASMICVWTVSASQSEESACFDFLTQHVNEQYWIDLSNVEKDERTGQRIDLSTYDKFRDDTVQNPQQNYLRGDGNFFAAKRNNIWTIQASGDYILSQFTGFGDDTAFEFPLRSRNRWYSTGDQYPDFRQNIVYTHHLLNGDFVSCGYLKINPLGTHNLQSLGQRNYKTNVFEGSGFEMLENSVEKDGNEFLVGKVSITAEDYADEPFFNIQLITVAYNNESSYFNEFETFPLQVQAMKNTDAYSGGLGQVMINFLQSVKQNTCLELVHPEPQFWWFSRSSLPQKCSGRYQSLSYAPKLPWFNFLIPSAHAKIELDEDVSEKMQEARWIVVYDGLSFELFEKLEQIPNENFRNWLQVALTPNYDRIIEVKQEVNELLTPEEEVFQSCGIDYTARVDIIIDFLENLDLSQDFDITQLLYSDPRFWDCVIPYPDSRHIANVIEESFASNQLYAEQLTSTGVIIDELSDELRTLILVQHEAESAYNTQMAAFQDQIDAGNITPELESQIIELQTDFDTSHTQRSQKIDDLIIQGAEFPEDLFPEHKSSNNHPIIAYIVFVILLIIGIIFIYFWIKRHKKTSEK